jgi:hypothetical protein
LPSNPTGTRTPIDWLPFEILPDDSERGYRPIAIYPKQDQETGRYVFEMHGYTPTPTVTDGYHVTATIELDDNRGAAVTRLVIEPSSIIQREDDTHRVRERDEMRLSPVNTTTLGLIKFTEIVNRIAEIEQEYGTLVAPIESGEGALAKLRATNLKKRGPRKDLSRDAKRAEQVLRSMHQGRGYQARLVWLDEDWFVGIDAVKKRIRFLRRDGWLHTDYGKPGSVLVRYRKDHDSDHSNKEED